MVSEDVIIQLGKKIHNSFGDAVIITGDIGSFDKNVRYLELLEKEIQKQIYFVLGNHDSYYGSFNELHKNMKTLTANSKYLKWMNVSGIVKLTPNTCLVGHDGFYDGRNGSYFGYVNSTEWMPSHYDEQFEMNDFHLIDEIKWRKTREDKLKYFNFLGDKSAKYFKYYINKAAKTYKNVLAITHVPPFVEVSKHNNLTSSIYSLPFYSCKALGDTLLELKTKLPNNKIVMFCGHCHSPAEMHQKNLHVYVAGAKYREPEIYNIIHIE